MGTTRAASFTGLNYTLYTLYICPLYICMYGPDHLPEIRNLSAYFLQTFLLQICRNFSVQNKLLKWNIIIMEEFPILPNSDPYDLFYFYESGSRQHCTDPHPNNSKNPHSSSWHGYLANYENIEREKFSFCVDPDPCKFWADFEENDKDFSAIPDPQFLILRMLKFGLKEVVS